MGADEQQTGRIDIAIVGMSLCVPGAGNVSDYWHNLRSGIESISRLDKDSLSDAGERPDLLADPNYVPAAATLHGYDEFDAEFFGFSPKEAAILDPQHRKFIEVAWSAMEDAGHPPESIAGPVGVYAGCGMGSYFYFNICSNPGLVDDVGMFLLRHTGNDKDFLSTRVSHVFDLKGPSLNIQTACSTSLVALHYACKALRDGECDMALAGGVTIELPHRRGYLYKENEILSPDGHCHAFDHRAQGTVFGSGAGAVVLRRLEDAKADGDHIWAVIRGSAVNNDGAAKAGYLAPSVDGQAAAVEQALKASDVSADTVDYVECHGTGTYLGDPIEVTALTQAYRTQTDAAGYCRIGSVKTNIGHLDTAAGVASLIKTSLALHHQQIPPSLGYEAPNPTIDFDTSPFRVNDRLVDWTSGTGPRRGAVNSLGVGGTNAHAILEEAPRRAPSGESDFPFQILCLSARSRSALDENSQQLTTHLIGTPELDLADVAYTLKVGRRGFEKRRIIVAETVDDAAKQLAEGDARQVFTHDVVGEAPETIFMFPGGGAQYAGMAQDLYETEPVFAEWMNRGLDHLQAQLDYDIRAIWLPQDDPTEAEDRLKQPSVQLPLIMIVEYALAQLWISWGVRPAALVGHSMGENTAACLAGVMTFESAIDLVLLRGRLFDTVAPGGMLSISLPLAEVTEIIGDDLDIASVNAPGLTAVSGPQDKLDSLAARLEKKEVDYQRIQIDIAAHSRMLDPILTDYRDFLRGLDLQSPTVSIISNRTGQELTAEQATSPDYWVEQLRNTVNFADCINTLARPDRVFLEVGPGKALSSLAQMCNGVTHNQVLSSLRHPDQDQADDAFFLGVIGRLWACGVEADWAQIWGEAQRNRLPLPTYAYQRSRYFIDPGQQSVQTPEQLPMRIDDISKWGWRPKWRPQLADCDIDPADDLDQTQPQCWLIFEDDTGVAARAADKLELAGHRVSRVSAGDTYARLSDNRFLLAPEQGRHGYNLLLQDLAQSGRFPDRIGHFWLVTQAETFRPGASFFDRNMEQGFYSLTALAQALGNADLPDRLHIDVFTTGAVNIKDEALPYPEKATIAGPAGAIPREFPGLTCATIDLERISEKPQSGFFARNQKHTVIDTLTNRILEELLSQPQNTQAALRGDRRYGLNYRAVPLDPADDTFREGGTYLITGGFGGIGQTLAADLLHRHSANVILLSRETLPPQEAWARYLESHPESDRTARRIRSVQALEDIGTGRVLCVAADVANVEQMRAAVGQAEDMFGALTGVIHAAGQIQDNPVLTKSESSIQQVLSPKISGLHVLDQIFPDGMLEVMVLCASTSTATRPAGQVDYIAANAYLNAWASQRANGATQVMAVNWGVWSDVGMAAEARKTRLQAEQPSERVATDLPLLDEAGFDAQGNRVFVTRLLDGEHWVLDEHRTSAGDALMPGTGYVELASQALRAHGETGGFEIRDLYFFRPLHVDAAGREMVLRLETTPSGYAMTVHSASKTGYVLHAQAELNLLKAPATKKLDLGAVAERCPRKDSCPPEQCLHSPQEAHLKFGPRWQVLRATSFGDREGWARLTLPDAYHGDLLDGYHLHPGLLDLATGWAIGLAPSYDANVLWVPVSYRSIRLLRPLPADIRSWVRLGSETDADGFATFDVTLTDAKGKICVEINGFQMQRLQEPLNFADPVEPDARAADLGLAVQANEAPLSQDEKRLHHNISQGITHEDGAEALRRALGTGLSQVFVSSMHLPDLIVQASQTGTVEADSAQSFDRPELDTAYVAPRNEIEKTLAGFFESLLGVSQVGVEDSFFDLGGHSLIAVRLFAQINRVFDIEFPMSLLFEAPNVASIAERIEALTGPADTDASEPQEGPPRFTHLVPLFEAENTRATPFFIVAGMFGNVLNLRHLALMLGRDRSVYGLQARGLIGEDEPHRTIDEAATACVEELRQVQPHGPYLLSGFSGGGITAFEMARQLEGAGEQVALLAMLDTPLPVRPELSKKDKALIKLHEIRRKGPAYLAEWARSRWAWEQQKRRKDVPVNVATSFNNAKVEAAFRAAVAMYQLQPWDGPLVLFRPPLDRHWKVSGGQWVNREREYVKNDNDWTRWVPSTQVVEVPGDHDSMVLVPNVSVLAERLKDLIAATEGPLDIQEAAE